MKIQNSSNTPSFKGEFVWISTGTPFLKRLIKENHTIKNFVDNFNGKIYVETLHKDADSQHVYHGGDEDLYKIFLSTKKLPKGLWNIIKSYFDFGFRKTSITRQYREEVEIMKAMANKANMEERLEKLKNKVY